MWTAADRERYRQDGLLYVLETGCQWRPLLKDLPPRSTVHDYLQRWAWDGRLEAVHHRLHVTCRTEAGLEASPSATISTGYRRG